MAMRDEAGVVLVQPAAGLKAMMGGSAAVGLARAAQEAWRPAPTRQLHAWGTPQPGGGSVKVRPSFGKTV